MGPAWLMYTMDYDELVPPVEYHGGLVALLHLGTTAVHQNGGFTVHGNPFTRLHL